MPPLSERISRSIKLAHVPQLAQQQEPSPQDIPREAPPPTLRESVLDWIQQNPESLRAAQTSQCTSASPSSPNWDAVFFSIMESAAMYLRKPELMAQTIRAARAGDFDAAITYLDAAQEDIDSVAKKLDCSFIQLCDFSQEGPEGTWLHTGAFCGLFISNRTDKPFKGVAFKGSNSMRDFITDLDWDPILPLQPGIAWGAKVHRGFYHGLFGHFEVGTSSVTPFDVLVDALSSSYEKDAMLHFTGHSLGGAFCTLTYGEFLRLQNEPAFVKYDFGDMYSIASPRTCIQPFAAQFDKLTVTGSGKYVFRIVNHEDPVPTVPPRTSDQLVEYPFIHVSGAWKLQDDGPIKMDDEPPPVDPQSIADIVWNNAYHKISDYYATWQHTPHSGKEA